MASCSAALPQSLKKLLPQPPYESGIVLIGLFDTHMVFFHAYTTKDSQGPLYALALKMDYAEIKQLSFEKQLAGEKDSEHAYPTSMLEPERCFAKMTQRMRRKRLVTVRNRDIAIEDWETAVRAMDTAIQNRDEAVRDRKLPLSHPEVFALDLIIEARNEELVARGRDIEART
ncbi:hypothetical protein EJ06DRAFT_566242 [Trichodelitschia bisporula]|uniref:Uncharacterized protein n=1 Tax=Trichodelitschia bisporula TaxID=703511 RepID=A0A6G1HNA3_9PEZI|nr:hypothetical protein EJ06DRAFT_566242 [Trichodelitschia bisporula]